MKITDITKQQKREDRFSVFVDGKYSFSLDANGLLDLGIKIGREVEEFEIEKLKQASSDSILLAKAYDKCMRRPHSEREIRDYLRKNQASEELSDFIIEKCKTNNFLNDSYFAERWIEMRRGQGKSTRYIQQELMQKGVDKAVSEPFLLGVEDNKDALRKIINKKSKSYSDRDKLTAYLQRQGFGYYDIVAELDATIKEAE